LDAGDAGAFRALPPARRAPGPSSSRGGSTRPAGEGRYRLTDSRALAEAVDPTRFYEPAYDAVLGELVSRVVAQEAPVSDALLVQRIARVHGFQQAGRVIRERIMAAVRARPHAAQDGEAGLFVWPDAEAPARWRQCRPPLQAEGEVPPEILEGSRDGLVQDAGERSRAVGEGAREVDRVVEELADVLAERPDEGAGRRLAHHRVAPQHRPDLRARDAADNVAV
jgi:hypothetical protein